MGWGSKFEPESADTPTLLAKLLEYKPNTYIPKEAGTRKAASPPLPFPLPLHP